MDFEDALFWLVALVQVAVAVRFSILMYALSPRLRHPRNYFLVRGQFEDGLLSAAVMGAIFLSKGARAIRDVLDLAGAFVLLWLVRRTLHRMRVLRRH